MLGAAHHHHHQERTVHDHPLTPDQIHTHASAFLDSLEQRRLDKEPRP